MSGSSHLPLQFNRDRTERQLQDFLEVLEQSDPAAQQKASRSGTVRAVLPRN